MGQLPRSHSQHTRAQSSSERGTGLNAVSKQGKTPWPFEADVSGAE